MTSEIGHRIKYFQMENQLVFKFENSTLFIDLSY